MGAQRGRSSGRGRDKVIRRDVRSKGKGVNDQGGGDDGRGEERKTTKWEKVVELVQLAFRDGVIVEEAAWEAVVLILKGEGDYCGICFVEVIWKAVVVILNHRFTAAITYHNFLPGFRAGCSTGTDTLKVKLLR